MGSNDLTQLILGVDRDNHLLEKLHYFDDTNLAVREAIRIIITGAKMAGKVCSICGDSPSAHPEIIKEFGLNNIDIISVSPRRIQPTQELIRLMIEENKL